MVPEPVKRRPCWPIGTERLINLMKLNRTDEIADQKTEKGDGNREGRVKGHNQRNANDDSICHPNFISPG